ncbi:ABC transporter permease [Photobacterium sp. ZSDE20]|uniref:Transport permease protein n=1 Tax=Photobacterium pectinilyticum TaxID=2906793 RepID=A0ABT1N0S8_9GAMM|nr:ABC transporter permease [Photobacterium sp. ZSDE20]MCQ1058340.1 ABC transporter permease [Photobacterium sp. ZSDE20]MDD1823135.1 ABC transporter permease [Photobacterium sp. ZSDE20]
MHQISNLRLAELIIQRAKLNLKSEASVNYLSYAWWIIEPLLHMVVYFLVFAVLLKRGGEGYVGFLLSGLVPWLWFSRSVTHAQNSILNGRQLMNQLYIPKIFFPLTHVLQDTAKQVIVFSILFVFLVFYGLEVSTTWLYIIPIFLLQSMLIVGCSLHAALIVPFIRDFSLIIPTALQFLMFCSGIFFNYKDIPEDLQGFFFINPMAVILRSYRDVLIDGTLPNFTLSLYVFILSLLLCVTAGYFYKKYDLLLPRVVLE